MQKRKIYILAAVLAIALLGGCGSSDVVQMDQNTTYIVYPGNEILADEASELVIDHQYGKAYKTVILTSGSARLFRE